MANGETVELAGEIAEAYPEKKVTMVFAGYRLLDTLKGAASIEAGKTLHGLGVTVMSGTKVSFWQYKEVIKLKLMLGF